MRALATRLGVVPAALYRHVRSKEQLHDLVLDGVLAEVDHQLDHTLAWTEQVSTLTHRLRTVLESHPGIAGLLKTRDPLGPHSLAVAEAFLAPLRAAGLPAADEHVRRDHVTHLPDALRCDTTAASTGRQPSSPCGVPPSGRRDRPGGAQQHTDQLVLGRQATPVRRSSTRTPANLPRDP
jgi:AcrR family transcriptional regulator